jgi:hypothetical protein
VAAAVVVAAAAGAGRRETNAHRHDGAIELDVNNTLQFGKRMRKMFFLMMRHQHGVRTGSSSGGRIQIGNGGQTHRRGG